MNPGQIRNTQPLPPQNFQLQTNHNHRTCKQKQKQRHRSNSLDMNSLVRVSTNKQHVQALGAVLGRFTDSFDTSHASSTLGCAVSSKVVSMIMCVGDMNYGASLMVVRA